MKSIKTMLAFLMVISMIAPAMAGVDVSAYREQVTTGIDSVMATAVDNENTRGTVTTSIGLDTGTNGDAWVAAYVKACSDCYDEYYDDYETYSKSYSWIGTEIYMDNTGTDNLVASSGGSSVITSEDESVVLTTSNSVLSTSLLVGSDSLQTETSGYVDAYAHANAYYGDWTYNYVYGRVMAGTDDESVYAIAWGYSEDPVFASISLDANVNVNGETASATLDGSATSSAVVVP